MEVGRISFQKKLSKNSIPIKAHPSLHLSWLKNDNEVPITKGCLVDFSIGNRHFDKVWSDVVPIDVCYILFGRLWQHDNKIVHDGLKNTYTFSR